MDFRIFVFYNCFLKSMKRHKIDTILGVINILVNQIVSLIFIYIIFSNVPMLDGWNKEALLLMYGLFVLNKGAAGLFTTSLYSIERHISDGSFDGMLIRPVSPIVQILGENIEVGELVNVLIGIITIVNVLANMPEMDCGLVVGVILLFLFLSIFLVFGIRLICMSVAFWTLTSFPVAIAVDNVSEFAKYPTTIYKKGLKLIIDYFIPFSVVAYFPALIIMQGESRWIVISIVITTIILCIACVVWKLGIKNYKSSGH